MIREEGELKWIGLVRDWMLDGWMDGWQTDNN